jgi:hypothetical protein
MSIKLKEAIAKVEHLLDRPCEIEIADPEVFRIGAGRWDALVFNWSEFSEEEVDEFINDRLGDAFIEDDEYIKEDEDSGLMKWKKKILVPFAFIGPTGMLENGHNWTNTTQVDLILFFDLKKGQNSTCPVLAWTGGPDTILNNVADRIEDLKLYNKST